MARDEVFMQRHKDIKAMNWIAIPLRSFTNPAVRFFAKAVGYSK